MPNGVRVVVFAETGLLAGFFLPGDSLLFTAGLYCSASAATNVHLSLGLVLLAAVAGALIGAQAGFWLGRRGGRRHPAAAYSKMSSGRNAEIKTLGTSTTWLTLRSTATLHSA